jgi:hypothetical protein
MKYTELPEGSFTGDGKRVKIMSKQPNHDLYVVHPKQAYYRLEEKLLQVNAPALSYRLFYLFATELDMRYGGNLVPYTIKQLCAHFKLSDQSIYTALAGLITADVVRKHKRHVLELDPYIAFAGELLQRNIARKKWNTDTLSSDDPIYTDTPEDTTLC